MWTLRGLLAGRNSSPAKPLMFSEADYGGGIPQSNYLVQENRTIFLNYNWIFILAEIYSLIEF